MQTYRTSHAGLQVCSYTFAAWMVGRINPFVCNRLTLCSGVSIQCNGYCCYQICSLLGNMVRYWPFLHKSNREKFRGMKVSEHKIV